MPGGIVGGSLIYYEIQIFTFRSLRANTGEGQYRRKFFAENISAIWRVSIGDRSEVARLTMKNAEAFEMTSLFDEFFNFTRSSKIGQMQDIT